MAQRDSIPQLDSAPDLALYQDSEPEVDREALRASALRQGRWLVDFYRITVEELRKPAEDHCKMEIEPAAAPIKYRHPVTGQTWDGQGAHPDWMRQALLKDGYRVAELRVESHDDF